MNNGLRRQIWPAVTMIENPGIETDEETSRELKCDLVYIGQYYIKAHFFLKAVKEPGGSKRSKARTHPK